MRTLPACLIVWTLACCTACAVAPVEVLPSPPSEGDPPAEESAEPEDSEVIQPYGGVVMSCPTVVYRSWFTQHREPDGSWSARALRACPECGDAEGPIGDPGPVVRTALSLLTHLDDRSVRPFRRPLRRGLEWLRAQQDAAGRVGEDTRGQILAAAALDMGALWFPALREASERALEHLVVEVAPALSRPGADPVEQGWLLLMLAGGSTSPDWDPPAGTLERLAAAVAPPDTGAEPLKLAVGVLARVQLGRRDDPAVRRAASQLADLGPTRDPQVAFFVTRALFQLGGPPWEIWRETLEADLIPSQRVGGCPDGSWDPAPGTGADRGLTTSLRLLALRHCDRARER